MARLHYSPRVHYDPYEQKYDRRRQEKYQKMQLFLDFAQLALKGYVAYQDVQASENQTNIANAAQKIKSKQADLEYGYTYQAEGPTGATVRVPGLREREMALKISTAREEAEHRQDIITLRKAKTEREKAHYETMEAIAERRAQTAEQARLDPQLLAISPETKLIEYQPGRPERTREIAAGEEKLVPSVNVKLYREDGSSMDFPVKKGTERTFEVPEDLKAKGWSKVKPPRTTMVGVPDGGKLYRVRGAQEPELVKERAKTLTAEQKFEAPIKLANAYKSMMLKKVKDEIVTKKSFSPIEIQALRDAAKQADYDLKVVRLPLVKRKWKSDIDSVQMPVIVQKGQPVTTKQLKELLKIYWNLTDYEADETIDYYLRTIAR